VSVALNLLYGAAVLARLEGLTHQGVRLPFVKGAASPVTDAQIRSLTMP
jgi:hypothetical protein